MQQSRDARQRRLDRECYQPFHVFHRIGRLNDIDLHLIVRDVWHRINRQPRQRHCPDQRQNQRRHHHQHAVLAGGGAREEGGLRRKRLRLPVDREAEAAAKLAAATSGKVACSGRVIKRKRSYDEERDV